MTNTRTAHDPNSSSDRSWRQRHATLLRSACALTGLVGLVVILAAFRASGSTGSVSAKSSTSSGLAKRSATASWSGLTGGRDIAGKTILWDWQSEPSNTFGVPLLNGAKAAAALTGLKLDVEYGSNSDTTQANQIRTAIAKHVAGFAIGVPDPGLNKALCEARKTGAPVVTFNINGASGKAATDCVQSFIGQSFVAAGKLIANYMVSHGLIKRGDHVFCPVETPAHVYAVQRRQGVNNVLGRLGITCETVGTGDDLGPAKATLVQYLLGHKNTSAIIALGGTPLAVSEAALKQVGLKIPIGGFDLSFPQIVTGLKDGAISASVNQEPYAQGFYSVMEIALNLKFGIPPMNINTSDNALITKQNVGSFAALVPDYQ
jgi:simple sugar transport system substrate-binding protein